MIKNVPTSGGLTASSLRLYFAAWSQTTDVLVAILNADVSVQVRDREFVLELQEGDEHFEGFEPGMFADLIRRAQTELQLVYSLIQQSQELALKARICSKSPFLLLLGTDIKAWAKSDADFHDFRTIDASDLVRVVNALFSKPLSQQFVTRFDNLRRGRNKLIHLGVSGELLDPLGVIDILVEQYIELYPDRRAKLLTLSLEAHFYDKNINEKTVILEQVAEMKNFLTKAQRYCLLGFPEGARILRCPECHHDARADVDMTNGGTADLVGHNDNSGEADLKCCLCDKSYKVEVGMDECQNCGHDVIVTDTDFRGECCTCGHDTLSD